KVSKFKLARQAGNPSEVKVVSQKKEPEFANVTSSPAVLIDDKKVSKFKAARQAAIPIEAPATSTEVPVAANVEERAIKDTVLERGVEEKADKPSQQQQPAAKKSLFRERLQK
ncbi:hypothetical protein HDU78_008790, partial [Chytriomyces hyalinus]